MFRAMKLCRMEVVNVNDARRIGFIHDVEIDENDGSIKAVIVRPKGRGIFTLFGKGEYVIPWHQILVWGRDLVLVRIDE